MKFASLGDNQLPAIRPHRCLDQIKPKFPREARNTSSEDMVAVA
jgi:hypothetical protein